MTSYTRCGCGPGIVLKNGTIVPPSKTCPDDCLYSPDIVVRCNDSVFAGEAMSVDLTQETNASTFCKQGTTYELYDYDKQAFNQADVSADGEFTGIFTANPGSQFPWIKFIVRCQNEMFASIATLRICVKSRCTGKSCPPGTTCDPATGTCVPTIDIEVT